MHDLTVQLQSLTRYCLNNFPADIWLDFVDIQIEHLHSFFILENKRLGNKYRWLRDKHIRKTSDTKSITYFAREKSIINTQRRLRTRTIGNINKEERIEYSFSQIIHTHSDNIYNIIINPTEFNSTNSLPLDLKNNWFINLTDVNSPPTVIGLLQLGSNFCLPITNSAKTNIALDIIKCVESKLMNHNINRVEARNLTLSLVEKFVKRPIVLNDIELDLIQAEKLTKNFLKHNNNIIITRADKGNVTVAIRISYMEKMNNLLFDMDTYNVVNRDPTNQITTALNDTLRSWKNNEYITKQTYCYLRNCDGMLPRAYGVPKIHKEGCPLRIIISSVNSALYNFAYFLHKTISSSLPENKSSVKDCSDLVKDLSGATFPCSYKLISLVVALFTNVPTDLAIRNKKLTNDGDILKPELRYLKKIS